MLRCAAGHDEKLDSPQPDPFAQLSGTMNTPRDEEDREDLRYAEYVLGVLDANARATIERAIEHDPRATEEVARWQKNLLPLAEDVAPAAPSDRVWARLRAALDLTDADP